MLRQALNYAVNKQELADKLYSGAARRRDRRAAADLVGLQQGPQGLSVRSSKRRRRCSRTRATTATRSPSTRTPSPRGYNPQGSKLAEAVQQYFEAVGVKSRDQDRRVDAVSRRPARGQAQHRLRRLAGGHWRSRELPWRVLPQRQQGRRQHLVLRRARGRPAAESGQRGDGRRQAQGAVQPGRDDRSSTMRRGCSSAT